MAILGVDVYHEEHPNWARFWARDNRDAGWTFAILKAGDGTSKHSWFVDNFNRARDAAGGRYGKSAFLGVYWFPRFGPGAPGSDAQLHPYLEQLDSVGYGKHGGELYPAQDIESPDGSSNALASGAQIAATTRPIFEALRARYGHAMLYGRSFYERVSHADNLGADIAWNPSATSREHEMPTPAWPRERCLLWQYAGPPYPNLTTFPTNPIGWQPCDVDVYKGRTASEMRSMRAFRRDLVIGGDSSGKLVLGAAAALLVLSHL